jgi:hypothetical protein
MPSGNRGAVLSLAKHPIRTQSSAMIGNHLDIEARETRPSHEAVKSFSINLLRRLIERLVATVTIGDFGARFPEIAPDCPCPRAGRGSSSFFRLGPPRDGATIMF